MLLSLVKTSTDDGGDRRLAREAQWLRELADIPSLEGQVPRLLEEGWRDGRRFLVLSLAQGSAQETRAFTADHARFLASLGKARFRVADFEVAGCCRWLQRAIANLSSLNSNQQTQDQLRAAYHDCESALLYWTGPYVLSQGEFAPWNIRNFGAQLFVYDWGRAHADASPLDDVLHYLMVQQALRSSAISAAALQATIRRAGAFALEAYPEWSWRPQVIGALTLVYLLGVVLDRSLAAGRLDRADPVTGAYWKLVEKRSAWMPA